MEKLSNVISNWSILSEFLWKTLLRYLTKVHGIPRSFYWSKTFGFYKISYRNASFMTQIWCFTQISQILMCKQVLSIKLFIRNTFIKTQLYFKKPIRLSVTWLSVVMSCVKMPPPYIYKGSHRPATSTMKLWTNYDCKCTLQVEAYLMNVPYNCKLCI